MQPQSHAPACLVQGGPGHNTVPLDLDLRLKVSEAEIKRYSAVFLLVQELQSVCFVGLRVGCVQ